MRNQGKIEGVLQTMFFGFPIPNLLYFLMMLVDVVLPVNLVHEIVLLIAIVHSSKRNISLFIILMNF